MEALHPATQGCGPVPQAHDRALVPFASHSRDRENAVFRFTEPIPPSTYCRPQS